MALFAGARASFGMVHRAVRPSASFFSSTVRPVARANEAAKRPRAIRNMAAASMDADAVEKKKPVPVTLLSGFLGSGKTTALKNLLENREGIKVGVIVNDVASVNIDARLLGGGNAGGDVMAELREGSTVELQNGCACCSLADELLTSIERLMDGRDFDAIVVELSGVADPVAVKDNWQQAKMMKHPATELADVNRVVTVVDACTFGTDWMTWNCAGEREGWVEEGDDCSAQRNVPELLAEQVESADLLLINKIDLAGPDQVAVATSLARELNSKAAIFEVAFGKVSSKDMLGNLVEDSHEHEEHADCSEPGCTDSTHDHSHSHEHAAEATCADATCTDTTHDHSHSSHDHAPADETACADATCTDPTHDHSHSSHDHEHPGKQTSMDKLGIGSFVYRSTVPFDAGRLMNVLNRWPVPIKDELDIGLIQEAQVEGYEMEDGKDRGSPFVGVLRSKGFCWLAPARWTGSADDSWRHDTAMFWSHAGKHFGITTAGKWWGTLAKDRVKDYFGNNMGEYERVMKEDWVTEEFGDRRQEIVFIGTQLDEAEITEVLDACLCTDEDMDKYRQQLRNLIDTTFTSEAIGGGGPSLFDTVGTEFLDMN
eukprot:CAMPEP_0198305572 /NCGR_PEP_ID=MMETSP1449-20131203/57972_1 /TAXON_ID=420275 /ORGANISM="Attheya septentrionalis, Strain CCMP2084" /LENGTH=600 /DNA_ID=CAMNT_0044008107 /DNA_START=90 /DNA_END=1892 /DNA_ORIENTATION=+